MQYTTRAGLRKPEDAEAADIADLNFNADQLSDYAVGDFICTSVTRPPAPWQGMWIFETDTLERLQWSGVSWWTGLKSIPLPPAAVNWVVAEWSSVKQSSNIAVLQFIFAKSSSFADGEAMGTLAAGWRPGSIAYGAGLQTIGSYPAPVAISVDTLGVIRVEGHQVGVNSQVRASISYRI